MAIVYTEDFTAAPASLPKMNLMWSAGPYLHHTRINYDSSWTQGPGGRPIIGFLHGSGATTHLTGPLLEALIAQGFTVVSFMSLGAGQSTRMPFRFGYGNVNSPHFMGHFIKDAYWAEAAYNRLVAINNALNANNQPIAILGQSKGAMAAVAWAAGMTLRNSFADAFKGIVCNAPTAAGLGNGSFNLMPRTVSTMSYFVERIKCKSVLMFGDLDVYAPPEYARRIQTAVPDGKETYIIAPGNFGHGWMSTVEGAPLAASWVNQLVRTGTILDRFGRPAKAGAVA